MKRIIVFLVSAVACLAGVALLAHSAAAAPSADVRLMLDTAAARQEFGLLGFGVAGMLLNIGQALTIDQLIAARAAPTGGYEVYQAPIYDTVTWPAAGIAAGGVLDVFTGQSSDETVTNLKQPGTIPKPDKFHARKLFLEVLLEQTISADITAAGRGRDLQRIVHMSRSVLKLTPSTTNRTRQPVPLHMIGSAGGVIVDSWGNDAVAAGEEATRQTARLSQHGGYPFDVILDSNEEIRGQFKAGVLSALTAAMDVKVLLWGYRYQKVS